MWCVCIIGRYIGIWKPYSPDLSKASHFLYITHYANGGCICFKLTYPVPLFFIFYPFSFRRSFYSFSLSPSSTSSSSSSPSNTISSSLSPSNTNSSSSSLQAAFFYILFSLFCLEYHWGLFLPSCSQSRADWVNPEITNTELHMWVLELNYPHTYSAV